MFSATRTDTFLGARYRRLARRRGKPKAIVAVGNSVLTVVYHLLSDADLDFCELGPAHYESRINKHRRAREAEYEHGGPASCRHEKALPPS